MILVWMVYCTMCLGSKTCMVGGINSIGLWLELYENNTWCKHKFSAHGTEEGEKGMTI